MLDIVCEMVGNSELSNSLLVMWYFCCCGNYAYFNNFDSTSGNFLCFWISRAIIVVLVFSQLSLLSFPKKASVVCWPLQAIKHPHSCLFTLHSGTGEHRRIKSEGKKVINPSKQWLAWKTAPIQLFIYPGLLLMSIISYGAEYPVGQFGSVILLAVLSQLPGI